MRFLALSVLCLLSSKTNVWAQIQSERTIDTISKIELQPIEGDTIFFSYSNISQPILFGKEQFLTEINGLMEEMRNEDSFANSDSLRPPLSIYLDYQKCVDYLDTCQSLNFLPEIPVLPIHLQKLRDFVKIHIGQLSCLLFEKGLFGFQKTSRFFEKPVYKTNVTESTKHYFTNSTKFMVDTVFLGECPPITHADFIHK